jgi:Metallo-peptidase family M12
MLYLIELAPIQGAMICAAREAGALLGHRRLAWLLAALMLAVAGRGLHAAEMRLLHADPSTVRERPLTGADAVADRAQLQLQFDAGGRQHVLRLRPNEELRATPGRVGAAGEPWQGKVAGYPDSWAAVTRIGSRWSGIWYDGAEYFGVDTARDLAPAQYPDTAAGLLVYRLRDVVWDTEPSFENDMLPASENGAALAADLSAVALLPGVQPSRRLAVAVVADALLAQQYGDELEANLLAQLNVIDGVFANQLGVRITAASVTLYEQSADEPFSNTADAEDLLDELGAWRSSTLEQRQAGLTHLFTGRDLQGRTVGMAYLDSLCNRHYSSSLSQATAPVSFAALVAAHEIAHVFGAPHDGDADRACATAPAGYLMAPRITGSQQFSSCSLEQMAPQLNAASCLSALPIGGEWPEQPALPEAQGGSGTLASVSIALLGLLAAARVRRRKVQMRANHSAR